MRLRTLLIGAVLTAILALPAYAQQPGPNHAGVVVVHGDGSVAKVCVSFSEESITGAELLRRAGLEVSLTAYGGLGYGVCQIGDEGCPADDCFCQCKGSPCAYWVYSHRHPDSSWVISGVGASSWQVHDGDVDGWVWGDGATAPPVVAFEDVCPVDHPVADVTPTQMASTITSASPTITPAPLSTVEPTTAIELGNDEVSSGPLQGEDRAEGLVGYAAFGLAALGLMVWLVWAGIRRRHA